MEPFSLEVDTLEVDGEKFVAMSYHQLHVLVTAFKDYTPVSQQLAALPFGELEKLYREANVKRKRRIAKKFRSRYINLASAFLTYILANGKPEMENES